MCVCVCVSTETCVSVWWCVLLGRGRRRVASLCSVLSGHTFPPRELNHLEPGDPQNLNLQEPLVFGSATEAQTSYLIRVQSVVSSDQIFPFPRYR